MGYASASSIPSIDIKPKYEFICTQESFEEHLSSMMNMNYWVFDVETTGKDPHTDKIILLQIGNKHQQFLIDTRVVGIEPLFKKFEDPNFYKIGQFLMFEYLMMKGNYGIDCDGLKCTFLAEKVLTCGIQQFGFSMEEQAQKYLGIQIDKDMQKSFINHEGPFSVSQKRYAALDVVYPDYIMSAQQQMLDLYGLTQTWRIECEAIPAFGDMEFIGQHLDTEAWLINRETEIKAGTEAKHAFLEEAAKFTKDVGLFGDPAVNPNSSAQVLNLFKNIFDPKDLINKKGTPSTDSEVLEKLQRKYDNPPIVSILSKIRTHDKYASTYGEPYVRALHPKTGKLHPKIAQLDTETGRPAGKKPNMLNIPAESRYRTPWIAGKGRKTLTDDFGACELRIMASMSGDPVMCKGFNDGLDYHTYTASQFIADNEPFLREFIPHPKGEDGKGKLGDYILDENGEKIKNPNFGVLVPYDKVLKEHRDVAKTINFGLAYGMGAQTLADRLNISLELSREYIKKFNTTFKVLVGWLRKNQELALELRACSFQELARAKSEGREPVPDLGFSETHLGRKRFFLIPEEPPMVKMASSFSRIEVGREPDGKPIYNWESPEGKRLPYNPGDPWDPKLPLKIKKYYTRIAMIKREGGNSPIQGGNADITKIAMTLYRRWIKEQERTRNNGEYLAHIKLQVYDELVVDCVEWFAEEAAQALDRIMRQAGAFVIVKVPVETDCVIAGSWVKG